MNTLVMVLLKRYWKELALTLSFVGILYLAGHSLIEFGHDKAEIEYNKRSAEYRQKLDTRIGNIETNSDSLVKIARDNQVVLAKDIKLILANGKQKPLTIINQTTGQCELSDDFLNTYNALIARGNKK